MFAGMFLFSGAVLWWVEGNLGTLGEFVFGKLNVYLLVAIPLFMLMAHFMVRGKVVDDLYDTAHTLVRHLPGGLGVATVVACAVFAAISGSSRRHRADHRHGRDPADAALQLRPARRLRRRRRRRHARHPHPALGADGALRLRLRHLDRRAVHGRRAARHHDVARSSPPGAWSPSTGARRRSAPPMCGRRAPALPEMRRPRCANRSGR